MKAKNFQRNARIIEMRRAGHGPREIARLLDISASIVAGVLHRAGVTDPYSPKAHSTSRIAATPEWIAAVVKSASETYAREAARRWGVHECTVANWARKAGVTLRDGRSK